MAGTMPSDTLPASPRHFAEPSEAHPSASVLAGMSVLILEDEPLVGMFVESCLQDAGAAVVIAASISAARSVLNESFDAVVIDLHVADGDASPLIGVLSGRGIPVVVTTGGTIDRELLTQTVAVLQKPYREANLIKVLAMIR
jgi:DNA-binding response OmpR family regulator